LGLHKTDFISFNKGCYKGQEIIARTHYKATIKHELKTDIIETSTPIFSGQKLFNKASGAEIGELIDYSILGNQRYLIAVTLLKDHSGPVVFERLPEP
jgi:folate-binding Fe-S cluster repair protein YgfZ